MHQPEQRQHQEQQPAFVKFKYWDQALKQFLIDMGLTQALKGFESDMLVLNSDWERESIPIAMATFVRNLVVRVIVVCVLKSQTRSDPQSLNVSGVSESEERSKEPDDKMDVDSELDQRKLAYVRPATGAMPQSQTSVSFLVLLLITHSILRYVLPLSEDF